jgi:hypothetical protein
MNRPDKRIAQTNRTNEVETHCGRSESITKSPGGNVEVTVAALSNRNMARSTSEVGSSHQFTSTKLFFRETQLLSTVDASDPPVE